MSQREEILAGLQPLFYQADRQGLWFYCTYQDLWFHPDELRKEHENGKFLWGAVNWQLRHPDDKLKQLVQRVKYAEDAVEQFKTKMIR